MSFIWEKTHTSVDQVRYDKVRESFSVKKKVLSSTQGIDLSKMPPCKQVLKLHMQRANLQAFIWRNAIFNNPDLPDPETNGWVEDSTGHLDIQWYKDNFIPEELQDVLADRTETDEHIDEDDDEQRESGDEYNTDDDDIEEDESDEDLDSDESEEDSDSDLNYD